MHEYSNHNWSGNSMKMKSDPLEIKGVSQRSVLGPLLFSIYLSCLDFNIDNVRLHFYADDTIVYCRALAKQQFVAFFTVCF